MRAGQVWSSRFSNIAGITRAMAPAVKRAASMGSAIIVSDATLPINRPSERAGNSHPRNEDLSPVADLSMGEL